jgi:hypothetical protein
MVNPKSKRPSKSSKTSTKKKGRHKPLTEREEMQSARAAVRIALRLGFERGYHMGMKQCGLDVSFGNESNVIPLQTQVAFNFELESFADDLLTQVHKLKMSKRGISPLRADLVSKETARQRRQRSKKLSIDDEE